LKVGRQRDRVVNRPSSRAWAAMKALGQRQLQRKENRIVCDLLSGAVGIAGAHGRVGLARSRGAVFARWRAEKEMTSMSADFEIINHGGGPPPTAWPHVLANGMMSKGKSFLPESYGESKKAKGKGKVR